MKTQNASIRKIRLGKVVLFGSGETSAVGGKVFDQLTEALPSRPRIAVWETPAGFQPNSAAVAGKAAVFIAKHFSGKHPRVEVIPARKKDTTFSPDNLQILAPAIAADMHFLGAGSPTYASRQLRDSLAWKNIMADWQQGAVLVFASAAAIAIGTFALPVYEIFKVGADLFWEPGLDLFAPFGLRLSVVTHWNNSEGGGELDTSRCFIGQDRFAELADKLSCDDLILGIDEHTAAILSPAEDTFFLEGKGGVTSWKAGEETNWRKGMAHRLSELANFQIPVEPFGMTLTEWEIMKAQRDTRAENTNVPPEVFTISREREEARAHRDFARADLLRSRLLEMGYSLEDTPEGSRLLKTRSD